MGIKDGYFLKDMDVEVTIKTVIALLEMLKDNVMFPVEKFSKGRLTYGIMVPYMRGVCTEKGIKKVKELEALFQVDL